MSDGRSYVWELVQPLLRTGHLAPAVALVCRASRARLYAQHTIVFVTEAADVARRALSAESGYEFNGYRTWDDVPASLREAFLGQRRYLWWNTENLLHAGARLWTCSVDGALAGVGWSRLGDVVDSYFFPLTARCALLSHFVTLPRFRGRHIYTGLLLHVLRLLAEEGAERFYIGCADWNLASQRGILRAGFQAIGRGRATRHGRLVWRQTARPCAAATRVGAGPAGVAGA